MSDTITSGVPPAGPPPRPDTPAGPVRAPDQGPGAGTWTVTWSGLRTVAALELRQRVRSTRWLVVLVIWVVLLAGLTLLVRNAVLSTFDVAEGLAADGSGGGQLAETAQELRERAGATVFGIVVFLVLSLGALVAPALSATSINGDRSAGVLATLQTTLLSPAEIVLGKLLAAWTTALALLVTALPFLLWTYLDGGTPAGRLLTTLAVVALTLLVVCAIGLGWSAVSARASSSGVLTYLTVMFLGLGLPVLFLVSLPAVQQEDTYTRNSFVYTDDDTGEGRCQQETVTGTRYHTERSWWLLAPNPYVVVSDASPRPTMSGTGADDPLTIIRSGVRDARLGPEAQPDECFTGDAAGREARERREQDGESLGITWPYGLAADLALGGLFVVVAVRRLRTPTRTLPRGTRVA